MDFQIYSDLHISINKKIPFIKAYKPYLILAGDIGKYPDSNFVKFIEYVNRTWKKTFYILGNHEAYSKNISFVDLLKKFRDFFKKYKNIVFLYNETYSLGDYLLVGSTMWSDPYLIEKFHRPILFETQNGLDFDRTQYLKLRQECIDFLNSIKTKKKVILLTHFPIINKYTFNKKHIKDKNYISWLTNNINIKSLPFYKNLLVSISGHTHYSYDFTYKGIRFIANQLGYTYFKDNTIRIKSGVFKL